MALGLGLDDPDGLAVGVEHVVGEAGLEGELAHGDTETRRDVHLPVGLDILDNYSTLTDVEDENDASSFNPVLQLLMKLRQQNRASILVHHARKASITDGKAPRAGSYRGTSKMGVINDTIIQLSPHHSVPANSGAAFVITFEKVRDERSDETKSLEVHLKTNPDGSSVWDWEDATDARVEEMVGLVKSMKYKTQKEIAKEMGISPATASRLWKKIKAEGLLKAGSYGRRVRP
ncbi:MAG: hypothetical protein K8S99_11555 [Planctomycetes bacterium]|nr:hypothetical protein [Planctomycetota bacterium]